MEKKEYKSCEQEGTFPAAVKDIKAIEGRFRPETMEVMIEFVTKDYEVGKTYLDFSEDYIDKGNNKGRRACDVSLDTLGKLGLQKSEFANLTKLRGADISIYGKRSEKTGQLNFFISNFEEKEMNPQKAVSKFNSLFGGTPTPPPAAPVNDDDPFGNDSEDDDVSFP